MRKRGYCCRRVTVWLDVTRWYCIETDKDIIKLFLGLVAPSLLFSNTYHVWLWNSNGKKTITRVDLGLIFSGMKTLTIGSVEEEEFYLP